MIEATCSACGTLNRIAETDVPLGAKFVNCASCKARVALPGGGGGTLDLADLPAPKPRGNPLGGAAPPPPLPKALSLDGDLPAPKAPPRIPLGGLPPKPAPPPPQGGINLDDFLAPSEPDLPAPKARGGRMTDLPATKPADDLLDLPAPKAQASSRAIQGLRDLGPPAPLADLPTPKGPPSNLPMPKGGGGASTDLAPKSGLDLPAPKGFFDDLPQPSKRGGGQADLPAPKGFFDDLPQPSKGGGGGGGTDIAPLGFFDDLPAQKKGGDAQVPAPKGYFDDLPQPSQHQPGTDLAPLDSMDIEPADQALDLAPSTPLSTSNAYQDLDLSKPSTPIRFDTPGTAPRDPSQASQPMVTSLANPLRNLGASDAPLELEADPRNRGPELRQKVKSEPIAKIDATTRKRSRRPLMLALAGVVVIGGGIGAYMFKKHADAASQQAEIDESLERARQQLVATDAGHWSRAALAAGKVLEVDETNPDALGIGAEASIAGALDEGQEQRLLKGRKMIGDALAAAITGPVIARAQALNAISMGQIDQAIARLQPMQAGGKDGWVALYLGWAEAAKGDVPAAIAAYDVAGKQNPKLATTALYYRAKVKLASGDLDGAHKDFAAVFEQAKDFIPAQVGLAASEPSNHASQAEADLLALLQRKDLPQADPRAVVQAWVLAGTAAMRGARLDAARERFHKALEINGGDVGALTGLAQVELMDGKLDAATDAIAKALDKNHDDANAQIVATELAIRQNKLDDADERIRALGGRQPPLPPLDQAHLLMAKGHLQEVQHKDTDAADTFVQAAKLAGDLDLGPTMAAVDKLNKLGQSQRATELLSALEAKAVNDPLIALQLGNGYLQSASYEKAEQWLRKASDARPTDPDAMFQLGKAMAKQGKVDDSIAQLKRAADIDPSRTEIRLELARTYEDAGRDQDAQASYDALLTDKNASLAVRGRAGRFFARTGQMDKAAIQGAEILKQDPYDAAGLYLKGEGLLAQGKAEEARRVFKIADEKDPEPQYLDAEGRACEEVVKQTNDTKWYDTALTVYQRAINDAPKMWNPWFGQGRIYSARREWVKANTALQAAWAIKHDWLVAKLIGDASFNLSDKRNAVLWYEASMKEQPNPEASHQLGLLYREENQAGPALSNLTIATNLAEKAQKEGKPVPTWLSSAYYLEGTIAFEKNPPDYPTAKHAWDKYLATNPTPGAELDAVHQKMNTTLRDQR